MKYMADTPEFSSGRNARGVPTPIELDFGPKNLNYFKHFNIHRVGDGNNECFSGQNWYIFITSPFCNFNMDNAEVLPFLQQFFYDKYGYGKEILAALSYGNPDGSPFIKLLTNCAESFSPPDTSANTIPVGETWTKLKHTYLGEDNDSKSGGTLTIPYIEKAGLPVTKLHKAWYEYGQALRRGYIKPNDAARKGRYIDYMTTAFFFLLAPDGETLEFWSRYVGLMPTNQPFSAFEGKLGGTTDKTIVNFQYSFVYKEDLTPEVLVDFNLAAKGHANIGNIKMGIDSSLFSWNNTLSMGQSIRNFFKRGTGGKMGAYDSSAAINNFANVATKPENNPMMGDISDYNGKGITEIFSDTNVSPENRNSVSADSSFEEQTYGASDVSVAWVSGGKRGGRAVLKFEYDTNTGYVYK